ncbi:hypothetical protein [Streptomyces sp. NPDC051577]|uniref:hypothetical protein n=1 Tax=Streptomyces sp. NPDC051577 TaxID=3155166 RepID=UPI00342DD33D
MIRYESLSDHEAASATALDVEDLICVTRPYFALEDLRAIAPGRAVATVPVEAERGLQAAVIGIGEVGRHLAILGLCAAATVNRKHGRHAYLARTARVEWLAAPTLTPPSGPLVGHAQAIMDTAKHATADTRLTDAGTGEILARMSISYDVLPHKLLSRLLGELIPGSASSGGAKPYTEPLPLRKLHCDPDTGAVSAELSITAGMCAGHFDDHPVLPVAVAATAMSNLVDYGITQRHPNAHWVAGPLTLTADNFARAGQTLTFNATPTQAMGYHCTAQLDGQTIAAVTIQLILVDTLSLHRHTPLHRATRLLPQER